MTHKVSLGGELAVAAGTYGGGALAEVGLDKTPILSYQRSRGFYAGVEAVAQAYLTRFDENERIYSMMGVTQRDIVSSAFNSACSTRSALTPPPPSSYYRTHDESLRVTSGQHPMRTLFSLLCVRPRRARRSANWASRTNTSSHSSRSGPTTGRIRLLGRQTSSHWQSASIQPKPQCRLPRMAFRHDSSRLRRPLGLLPTLPRCRHRRAGMFRRRHHRRIHLR